MPRLKANEMIQNLFNNIDVTFIDNGNIRVVHLWKDRLNVAESGKIILKKTFLGFLRKSFFNSGTPTKEIY